MGKINLNDHLDDMMERIMDEDIDEKKLKLETERAKTLCKVADIKIKQDKNVLDAVRLAKDGALSKTMEHKLLGENLKQIDK